MRVLLIIPAVLWAGAASAQIKGGGYEIAPEPERLELENRSHFHGGYIGGTFGWSRNGSSAAPRVGFGVNAKPHFGTKSRRGSTPEGN